MNAVDVLLTLGSVAVGALVTWLFAKHYYERASAQLSEEAVRLRRLNEIMLRGMEENGWIQLNRNEQGEIAGLIISASMHAAAKTTEVIKAS